MEEALGFAKPADWKTVDAQRLDELFLMSSQKSSVSINQTAGRWHKEHSCISIG